jgi:hypothetical protein
MKNVSCTCQSNGTTATITPVMPPSTKMKRKPSTNSSGVANPAGAPHSVAIQAKTWMPAGDGDHQAGGGEEAHRQLRQAGGEHVVHPQPEADEAGEHDRHHDQQCSHDRPRAKVGTTIDTMPVAGRNMM